MNCKYCGKENSPVRQVPLPMPVSECYCDDCTDACLEDFGPLLYGEAEDNVVRVESDSEFVWPDGEGNK